MKVYAIVLGAGAGLRFGEKKQFVQLAGQAILIRTLVQFQSTALVDEVSCVVPKEDLQWTKDLISKYPLPKVGRVITGGAERQDSVAAALFDLENRVAENDLIVVHDGVRPFVSPEFISLLVQKAKDCGAVVAARPVTDSLKRVSESGMIEKSVDREGLWAMQTPQVFRFSILSAAYEKGRNEQVIATDDATLVERLGVPIACIEGPAENIKITRPEDLRFAELFLKQSSEKVLSS